MNYMLDRLKAFENKMSDLITVAHHGQKYGDKSYTYHLRMVADNTIELFPSTCKKFKAKLYTTALGHDLIEDTHVTKDVLIASGYDDEVVEAIDLVTKKEGLSYKDYLKKLSDNELAWKVKVADTYSNMTQSIVDGDTKRVRKYSSQLELLYKYKSWEE
ncbi:hypothetical protein VP14_052 [Vibrio phage VPMCC14]|nr:hypothetical protein VP14_052 [Vibrio phage VPMCC14]